MKYWIMMSERSDEYELSIDGLPDEVDDHELNFAQGNIVSPALVNNIDLKYRQEPDERKTDNLVCAPKLGLVINARVKRLFDSLGINNIQYFPLNLINEVTNAVENEYCIANIVGKYACIDREKSSLEFYGDGEIMFINSLALSLDPGVDYGDIFRLAEYYPLMVVSSRLKDAVEREKITGLKIYAPEDVLL